MRSPKASFPRHTGLDPAVRRAATTCPIVTMISASLALTAATADALAIPTEFVEKDFWVVELLRSLFQPSTVSADVTIALKGGTSLSKGFGLIQRFSEDVDILVVPAEAIDSGRIDRELKAIISRGSANLWFDECQVKVGPARGEEPCPGCKCDQ